MQRTHTSTMTGATNRRIQLRRARLACVEGVDAGTTWRIDRDLVRIGSKAGADVVLRDPTVSRVHAEILRVAQGTLLRDLESTNGIFVGNVRVREVFLDPDTRFRIGNTALVYVPDDDVIEIVPSRSSQVGDMFGESVAIREVFGVLERVAPTDVTVLFHGETGTGKELAARALHAQSRRADGPFVVFDCSAVAEQLIESELFGHERGAFTGALAARPGVFEAADGGTLFIDEIGELPLALQPRLLRVLEQREVRRVGSNQPRTVDLRIVAATNRNLRDEAAAGRFREDLYYRLAVVEARLPPLRERLDDVPRLAAHLLARAGAQVRLAPDVEALFAQYWWPGNVRELNNVLMRAVPFCDGDVIGIDALPPAMRAPQRRGEPAVPVLPDVTGMPLKDAKELLLTAFERQYLVDLMERHRGNITRAARAADMDPRSISRMLKKHGIRAQDE
ncbi:MAG: sigma 54-interacting transcriptional regulator [Myxococcota bacterium]